MKECLKTALLLLPFLSGCDALLGGDDDNFLFNADRLESAEGEVATAEVIAGDRLLFVQGTFLTPQSCYGLRGNMATGNGTITITVTAVRVSGTCIDEPTAFRYELQAPDINRGTHRVRVTHRIDGQPDQTVFDEDVVVT